MINRKEMKTRTYPIVCPSCHGAGYIDNPEWDPNVTSSMTIICPACGGNKTVIVTETETKDDQLD